MTYLVLITKNVRMTPFDDVLHIILNSVKPLNRELTPVTEARGRVLFEDVKSSFPVPGFDNSAMDGFAIQSEDIKSASSDFPVTMPIAGEYQAGINEEQHVKPGTAVRIMTGAPIPKGADTIVPVEHTTCSGNTITFVRSAPHGDNIRKTGEDIAAGQVVLQKGCRLNSADLGLLASLNYSEVPVYKQPHIAILSTGNEIVEPGEPFQTGQVRNSNRYTLVAEIEKYNAIPHYLGIARDNREELKKKLKEALSYDFVITTGGVSMGAYDYVPEILVELGVDIQVRKVKMKPGKPLIFGTYNSTLVFGLPGNPVSTMISFIQFIRPAILKKMGTLKYNKPVIKAVLDSEIRKKPDRMHFIRGFFTIKNGSFHVKPTGDQGSGILRSMSEANCLVIIPEGISIARKGELVSIQLIHHKEI